MALIVPVDGVEDLRAFRSKCRYPLMAKQRTMLLTLFRTSMISELPGTASDPATMLFPSLVFALSVK